MSRGAGQTFGCLLLGLAVCAGAMLSGCANDPRSGYAFDSAFRTDIETVAVPIFDNTTFTHGLEVTLTDAIVKEIHRITPYRVVSAERADTLLSGTITNTDMRRLRTAPDSGLVQELAFEITVTFEWKDARSGRVLVSRRNFRAAESFVPGRGAQERLESGQAAAVHQMARDLVGELRSAW